MALSLFGVDADAVRRHCFPHMSPWSADTSPSAVTVAEKLDTAAGSLAGSLLLAGVSAATVNASPATPAYAACAGQLRLMTAIECGQAMTGMNPDALKEWQKKVDAWLKALKDGGATFLGDASLEVSVTSPSGPNTHIDYLNLEVPDAGDASPVTIPFRVSDQL